MTYWDRTWTPAGVAAVDPEAAQAHQARFWNGAPPETGDAADLLFLERARRALEAGETLTGYRLADVLVGRFDAPAAPAGPAWRQALERAAARPAKPAQPVATPALADAARPFSVVRGHNVTPPSPSDPGPGRSADPAEQRRIRWGAKRAAAFLTPAGSSLRGCGRHRFARTLEVRVTPPEQVGRAWVTGLKRCRQNVCPTCGPTLQAERAAQVTEVVTEHRARRRDDGPRRGEYLVTLTVPHDNTFPLAYLQRVVSAAWRRVQQGAPWQRLRDRMGLVGMIRAAEVTTGGNGWHPHLHVLMLTDREWSDAERTRFRRLLFARWTRALETLPRSPHLPPIRSPGYKHGLTVVRCQAANYLTKLGLADELARPTTKLGRRGHRTPLQLLADLATTPTPGDRERAREYLRAMRGRRALTWSRGLRAEFRASQLTLALPPGGVAGEVVGVLTGAQWDAIGRVRYAPEPILQDAAEQGGAVRVARAIDALLALADARGLPAATAPTDGDRAAAAAAARDRARLRPPPWEILGKVAGISNGTTWTLPPEVAPCPA